jgi:hypothetical protein
MLSDSLPSFFRSRQTMSDIATTTAAASRRETAPDIKLPNGKTLTPRARFGGEIGACDRTVKRMNLETVYVAGIAYVERESSLQEIASRARRRNEPQKRRRA